MRLVNFQVLMNPEGIVFVSQVIQCQSCGVVAAGFLNMSKVVDDVVQEAVCPVCGEEGMAVITYRDEYLQGQMQWNVPDPETLD